MKMSRYTRKYIDELANKGGDLISSAFNKADYQKDKTQNLHDSYGSAVYLDGKLIQDTIRVLTPKATIPRYNMYEKEYQYGKEEILEFFNSYKPKTNGIELVVAAAMFYGVFLEKKSGNLKRKYKVISGINEELEQLAKKTGGKVRSLM